MRTGNGTSERSSNDSSYSMWSSGYDTYRSTDSSSSWSVGNDYYDYDSTESYEGGKTIRTDYGLGGNNDPYGGGGYDSYGGYDPYGGGPGGLGQS